MKKNIKRILALTFISVGVVVSLAGRHSINQTKTDTKQTTITGYYIGTKDSETTQSESSEEVEIVDNIIDTVLSGHTENTQIEDAQIDNSTQEPAQEIQEPVIQYDYKDGWTSASVNVRTAPSTDSEILDVYKFNTKISCAVYNDKWSIIQYKDTYAYVYSNYISDTEIKQNSYTDDELYMLSHLIMGEAGGESDTCQLYVGSVVLNRMKHKHFPNTMKEVIFQKGQYACTWDGNYNKTPTERCIKNAKKLLEYGSVLPDNVIWQAGFKQGKGVYVVVDETYFCY